LAHDSVAENLPMAPVTKTGIRKRRPAGWAAGRI